MLACLSGIISAGNVLFVERQDMAAAESTESSSVIAKTTGFVHDSIAELKKVTRPTWQETNQATIVSMIIMACLSIALFLLDWIFSGIVSTVLIGTGR